MERSTGGEKCSRSRAKRKEGKKRRGGRGDAQIENRQTAKPPCLPPKCRKSSLLTHPHPIHPHPSAHTTHTTAHHHPSPSTSNCDHHHDHCAPHPSSSSLPQTPATTSPQAISPLRLIQHLLLLPRILPISARTSTSIFVQSARPVAASFFSHISQHLLRKSWRAPR
ncbi:hypothetical protein K440DRAFT_75004 [Wilcoxina mikolae CBS 423.85]|nr:hypothetical protein K440DRAFT_75004 [Wilcoxina mikolae CBS 423.85]